MTDDSIKNWQRMLEVYHESCNGEVAKNVTDRNFDRASISDDLHVIVNEGIIGIDDVKGVYLEDDRAIFKLEGTKYVEAKEGSQKLDVSVYQNAEITDIEFSRDAYTIIPKKVIFKDDKGRTFNLDSDASQSKNNLNSFIKL